MTDSQLGLSGNLKTRVVRNDGPKAARGIRTPFGRIMLTRDTGSGSIFAREQFMSHLQAIVRGADGRILDICDLGSGLVTNAGVNLLANDPVWTTATLKRANSHLIGTGTTADAATDVYCQTPIAAGSLTGSTNGYMTGTQSYSSPNKLVTVATFTANAPLAVTEWALCIDNAAPIARTSAGAAPTNNTFTDTGATFPTAGTGLQQYTIEINSTIVNTPTTTVMGQILSDTATVLTIQGGSASAQWLTLANASASNPSATVAYNVFPTAFDHRQFAAINVVATNTIQFTYTLTSNSGG